MISRTKMNRDTMRSRIDRPEIEFVDAHIRATGRSNY